MRAGYLFLSSSGAALPFSWSRLLLFARRFFRAFGRCGLLLVFDRLLESHSDHFHFLLLTNRDANAAWQVRTVAQGDAPLPHLVQDVIFFVAEIHQNEIALAGPGLEAHLSNLSGKPLSGFFHLGHMVIHKV